ncbi:MAG TPA: VOC family protein [Stellaceae bacterium]|nr:VOC family protein [Stellaceae bacterium]
MSANGGLFLDHVAVVVPDLARAAKTYERLGFRLTPQSSHKGPLKPGGPLEPYGSGNHCAMFAEGYLEILGITDPKRYTDEVAPLLQRYAGLHLVALGCRDARQAAHDLGQRLGAELSLRELGRDVPQVAGGTKPALFRIVGLPAGTFTEAKLFLIEQVTPEVLWQPALLDQPNGVTGLAGAVLCVTSPAETRQRLSRIVGHEDIFLSRGALEVVDRAELSARYGIEPSALPMVAAARFTVRDATATANYLRGQGVPFLEREGRIWVKPEAADGAIVEFVPASASGRH